MEFNTIVKFKSVEDNYRKETSGKKRNTVRVVNCMEDNILSLYVNPTYTDCTIQYIKISLEDNKREKEYMIRPLTDITRFESHGLIIYIFSW